MAGDEPASMPNHTGDATAAIAGVFARPHLGPGVRRWRREQWIVHRRKVIVGEVDDEQAFRGLGNQTDQQETLGGCRALDAHSLGA